MDSELEETWRYQREYGFFALGRAVYSATFSQMLRPYAHQYCVVSAAQGAEITLKARISEEHPLLIFEKIPRSRQDDEPLNFDRLSEEGRTIAYRDLPSRLWATRSERIPNEERFLAFGKLRNQLIHYGSLERSHADRTLEFVFGCIEPFVRSAWDMTLIPSAESWDEVIFEEGYLLEKLKPLDVEIDVSPEAVRSLDGISL